uniref:(northern house mosquito) hypothetical protein n=1 Tax=Culex pipiens TaxID=7175 RepID=A0A8D8AYG7_CULPI
MFRAVRQGILGPLDQDGSRSVGRGLPVDRKCVGAERFPVRAPVRPVLVQLHPADQGHPGDGRRHLPVPSGPLGNEQDHGRRGAAGAPSADHLRQLDPVAGRVRGRGRHDGMLRLGLSAAADYLASREQRYLANRWCNLHRKRDEDQLGPEGGPRHVLLRGGQRRQQGRPAKH